MSKKMVKIVRTVRVEIVNALSDDNYPGMTEEEVLEYERNMDGAERIEATILALEFSAAEPKWSVDASTFEIETTNVTCGHCGANNEIEKGTDPGEYRCIGCVEWLQDMGE